MAFTFDPALPPDKNIEKFYDHMATVDKGFAIQSIFFLCVCRIKHGCR